MRIGVIGFGGIGTAACLALARRGHAVEAFEQFHLDHDRGGSFGGSRIIRRSYPDPLYARLMTRAYSLWEAIEKDSGEALFLRCGGLFLGPAGHPRMTATRAALESERVAHEALVALETERRFPAFRMAQDEIAFFEPGAGLLRASSCVRAMAGLARREGVVLHEHFRVQRWEGMADGVRIEGNPGQIHDFDRVLLCPGPWIPVLLPALEPFVKVTRQYYAYLEPQSPGEPGFSPEHFPIWIDMARNYYGFPEHGEIPGVKLAHHDSRTPAHADHVDREPTEADRSNLRSYARQRLPGLGMEVTYEKICLYDSTSDEDFVVDRLPSDPRVVVAAGTSGHGFKFLPLLGELAAQLLEGGPLERDLGRFGLNRLGAIPGQ